MLLLQRFDQPGGFEHVLWLHHLGEANAFYAKADDDVEVSLEPWRRKRIHTHVPARATALLLECGGNHAAGVRLFRREHTVLDIKEDGIGVRSLCLLDEPFPVARHEHPRPKLLVTRPPHGATFDGVTLNARNQ